MSSTDDVIFVSHAKKASTHVAGQRRTCLDVAGKLVDLATTISDFDEVLSGNCDDIPEAAFYMVGGLADVKEKAASLAAASAK